MAIDARDCDPALVRDAATVAGFLTALVDAIGMKAYGDPEVVEFGEGGLHGLSAKQWIYTSSITWHAGGGGAPDEAYLDIFTCGHIDPPGGRRTPQRLVRRHRYHPGGRPARERRMTGITAPGSAKLEPAGKLLPIGPGITYPTPTG